MTRIFRQCLALLVCTSLVGCTTMRVVADGERAAREVTAHTANTPQRPNPLLVTTKSGMQYEITLHRIDGDAIVATVDGQQQPLHIPFDQIERIEQRQVDGTKTLLLVVAVLGLAYVFAQAFARGIWNSASK